MASRSLARNTLAKAEVVLAVGTEAMTAGVRDQDLAVAFRALGQHPGTLGRAAVLHRRERFAVRRQQRIAVAFQELGLEGVDDRREPDHLTCPQSMRKPLIKALIFWLAWRSVVELRWVYLAVVRIEW